MCILKTFGNAYNYLKSKCAYYKNIYFSTFDVPVIMPGREPEVFLQKCTSESRKTHFMTLTVSARHIPNKTNKNQLYICSCYKNINK